MSDTLWSSGVPGFQDGVVNRPSAANWADTFAFGALPIGCVVPYFQDLTGVPTLPDEFMVLSGGVVDNANSPLDGETLPDLNSGTQRFIRGSTTSGGTGGSDTHTHTAAPSGDTHNTDGSGTLLSTESNLPKYYQIVWITRISAGGLWQNDGTINLQDGEGLPIGNLNTTFNAGALPIGAGVWFLEGITGMPSLPSGFNLVDGTTIADAESPLNGTTLPDINGENRFLRGATSSGTTGGADTHTHSTTVAGVGYFADSGTGASPTTAADHTPPYYEAPLIIRIAATSDGAWNASGVCSFLSTDEVEYASINATFLTGFPPVGSVCGYLKDFTGVPSLPESWVELNSGVTVSDSESPINGQALPAVNGTSDSDRLFMRAADSSGGTGGAATHTHSSTADISSDDDDPPPSTESNIPACYNVVMIARIK